MKPRDEQKRRDQQELEKLGYVQQLFRDMGGFSNFALSFSIIAALARARLRARSTGARGTHPYREQEALAWNRLHELTEAGETPVPRCKVRELQEAMTVQS